MPRYLNASLLAVSILSAACAGPRIAKFDVQPRAVCAGEKAVLRWTTTGDTAMTMQLEIPAASTAAARSVPQIFKLRLVATKAGREAIADQELIQLPPTSVRALAFPTTLQGASVVASGSTDTAVWNDRVQVSTVATSQTRPLEVRHAGRTASLAGDRVTSDAFSGTAFGGQWELQSPLNDAELSQPSLRPTDLELQVTIVCKPEKP